MIEHEDILNWRYAPMIGQYRSAIISRGRRPVSVQRSDICHCGKHYFFGQGSPILENMNRHKSTALRELALGIGGVAVGFVAALLETFRDLLASPDTASKKQLSIQDADLVGDYNFRTQRFDSGTDPAGWYEDEP